MVAIIQKIEYGNYLEAFSLRVTMVGGQVFTDELNQRYTQRVYPKMSPMDTHGGFVLALHLAQHFGPTRCAPQISHEMCRRAKEIYQEAK